ncbi:hypothetical protein [Methanobrevibacter sp.]
MGLYSDFVEDYNNTKITAHDVRRINNLNGKQYSNLRNMAVNNGDIPPVRHMNSTKAKFYSKTVDGVYTVQKTINNRKLFVGRFPDEETARLIVDKCLEVEWELNRIQDIIDLHKIKPKNYSLVNGYYVIQKSINGVNKIFATIKQSNVTVDVVESIVGELRRNNWNEQMVKGVLEEFNIN